MGADQAGHSKNNPPQYALTAVGANPDGVGVSRVWSGLAELGECPLWDPASQRLYWIDSLGMRVWCRDWPDGKAQCWQFSGAVGSIGLRRGGGLVAGLEDGFYLLDLKDGHHQWIGDPEPDHPDTRLNDGKVDAAGRFWCGSMNRDRAKANAALYRLDPDLTWTRMDGDFTVSNGIAWSPDGKNMYFSDSRRDRSYVYDFDWETGQIGNRRPYTDTAAFDGRIDGATVDRDGNYWAALFDGGAVACFAPDGKLLRSIPLPVSCPTMCSFGGPDLDILYVTSARFSLSPAEQAAQPLAGTLFAITGTGAIGLPEPEFAG